MNPIHDENKVEKSIRNSEKFLNTLGRASQGEYDLELDQAREENVLCGTSMRLPLLKVTELFTIRKKFSLEKGEDYYQLYKEKFYIENPGSNYFETVDDTIYRKVVAQKEKGDLEWATAVSQRLDIDLEGETEEAEATEATE